jgi:ribonuclease P protein component
MRKDLRMGSPKLFRLTYSQGRSVATGNLVLYFLRNEDYEKTKVGFSVSKKIGNAVVRNRVKRRLRGIVATDVGSLEPGFLLVFVARPKAASCPYSELRASAISLLKIAKALRTDGE